jgi:probable rRNA maturation factor
MVEINNRTKNKIDLRLVATVAKIFLKHFKQTKKELSLAFVCDAEIRKLNKQYRKLDKVTDVLAFGGEGDFFGEVVIDYDQIKRQARVYSPNIKNELVFILVHGLLHLLGHEDSTKKGQAKMNLLATKFISSSRVLGAK